MSHRGGGRRGGYGWKPIVLNGRAASRTTISGVERWAGEVMRGLVALQPERYVVLAPPATTDSRAAGQAWEQFVLPAMAKRLRASIIWSPANLAPWAWPRNVLVLHDAAVLRVPEAYSRTYRAWHGRIGLAGARRALSIVTVSQFSRDELVEVAGIDPDKIVVIPGGVDARFQPGGDYERVAAKLGLDRPYVLTVGTSDARKNLSSLSRLAGQLNDMGTELVWAGGARSHITEASGLDALRPLGYVEEEDLPGLYGGARAFVMPSRYEGFGLPCLEAMACGTPVVAADRAALPETCGGAALLVDPDDPEALAEAVLRAATEEALRVQMRVAGLRRAAEATWDCAVLATDTLLTSLLGDE